MFLPDNQDQQKQDEAVRRKAYVEIEGYCMELIPQELRETAHVSVQEVQCGDPQCAPIDTAISILFDSGGRGMIGLPMEAKEVTMEEIKATFPPPTILKKWHAGQEADWPPLEEDVMGAPPTLRFSVGTKVQCRIGPDPVSGWASGKVIQLWYREPQWPPNSKAPYKIELDDGRNIFAPGDLDQIIRLHPDVANATSNAE